MKISKTRLKEIIKEEIAGLGEGDESNQDAQVRLQRVADALGAREGFVAKVRDAIAAAASTHARAEEQALGFMIEALELLLDPAAEDTAPEDDADDVEALVLGKDGPPSPEKIARQQRQLDYGFDKWRK